MNNEQKLTEITVRRAGPIVVRGAVILKDNDGKEMDLKGSTIISICGCGKAKVGLLCDGSHNKP